MSSERALERRLSEVQETVAVLQVANAELFTQIQRSMDEMRDSIIQLRQSVEISRAENKQTVEEARLAYVAMREFLEDMPEEQQPETVAVVRPFILSQTSPDTKAGQAALTSEAAAGSAHLGTSPTSIAPSVALPVTLAPNASVQTTAHHTSTNADGGSTSTNTSPVSAATAASSIASLQATAGPSTSTVIVAHTTNRSSSQTSTPTAISAERRYALSRDLWEAANDGNPHKIRQLMAKGANVQYRDDWGYTALHKAASNGHVNALKALVELGAPLEAETHDGSTPLHYAAFYNHIYCVKELLSAGANINARDKNGYTPLHDAARNDSRSVVRLLISAGADQHARDKEGLMPRDIASVTTTYALLS